MACSTEPVREEQQALEQRVVQRVVEQRRSASAASSGMAYGREQDGEADRSDQMRPMFSIDE